MLWLAQPQLQWRIRPAMLPNDQLARLSIQVSSVRTCVVEHELDGLILDRAFATLCHDRGPLVLESCRWDASIGPTGVEELQGGEDRVESFSLSHTHTHIFSLLLTLLLSDRQSPLNCQRLNTHILQHNCVARELQKNDTPFTHSFFFISIDICFGTDRYFYI